MVTATYPFFKSEPVQKLTHPGERNIGIGRAAQYLRQKSIVSDHELIV